MRKILFLLLSLTLIISCNKEDDPIKEIIEKSEEPIEVKQPEGYYFVGTPSDEAKKYVEVIYNEYKSFPKKYVFAWDENREQIIFKGELQFNPETRFIFNEEGKLTDYKINSEISFTFTYQEGYLEGKAIGDAFEWYIKIDNNYNTLYFYAKEIATEKISGAITKYDADNRIVKEDWWQDGILVETTFFEYKPNGNILKIVDEYGQTRRWYEYNSNKILIWTCKIAESFTGNPDNNYYKLEWLTESGKVLREEHRHVSDSSLYYFKFIETTESGMEQQTGYSIYKDFAINSYNPSIFRFKGDTILSFFEEFNQDGNKIKDLNITLIGNSENDISRYYFIQTMHEYDNDGKEIAFFVFDGDYRLNVVEKRQGDYIYSETHGKLLQYTEYDSNNIAVFLYTYLYVYNQSTEEYDYFQFNCFDVKTNELLWYRDQDGIKRKPDGTIY